jgi:hypothetical protein
MAKQKSRKSVTSLGIVGHPKRCRASLHGTNMREIKVNARDVWGLPPMLRRKEANAG